MRDILAPWLSSLSAEELVAELLELADSDPGLRLRLELRAAAHTANVSALRRAVTDLLETDDHLGPDETTDYADDVYQAAEAIETLFSDAPERAAACVSLAREAFGLVRTTLASADDPEDAIGDAARELLGVHLRACQAADPPPDPVDLGTYLADLIVHDTSGITPSLEDYATLLGRDGALAIRRRITEVHEADPDNLNARYLAGRAVRAADGDEGTGAGGLPPRQEDATAAAAPSGGPAGRREELQGYLSALEPLLDQTGEAAYREIARLLQSARACHEALGTLSEFEDYLTRLRAAHKRKRKLMGILDSSGLLPFPTTEAARDPDVRRTRSTHSL
jgi:hypothetical protein